MQRSELVVIDSAACPVGVGVPQFARGPEVEGSSLVRRPVRNPPTDAAIRYPGVRSPKTCFPGRELAFRGLGLASTPNAASAAAVRLPAAAALSQNDAMGLGSKFLREHESLADARHVGPVAHENVDQLWHLLLHRAVERGFIIELISRLMNSGVG
jgi:hypothetical protein